MAHLGLDVELDPGEEARPQAPVAVRELGLARNVRVGGVHRAAHQAERPLELRCPGRGRPWRVTAWPTLHRGEVALGHAEAELQRGGLLHDEGHGALAEPLADVGAARGHDPVDRRGEHGVGEALAGGVDAPPGRPRARRSPARPPTASGRRRPARPSPSSARPFFRSKSRSRVLRGGVGPGEVGLGARQVQLDVLGLQLEERLPLAHQLPLVHEHAPDAAARARHEVGADGRHELARSGPGGPPAVRASVPGAVGRGRRRPRAATDSDVGGQRGRGGGGLGLLRRRGRSRRGRERARARAVVGRNVTAGPP